MQPSPHDNLNDIEIQYLQSQFSVMELNQCTAELSVIKEENEENFEVLRSQIIEMVGNCNNINQISQRLGKSAGRIYLLKKRIAKNLYEEGAHNIDEISQIVDLPVSLLFNIPCIGVTKRHYMSQQESTPLSQKSRTNDYENSTTPCFDFEQSSEYVAIHYRLEGHILSNPRDHFRLIKKFSSEELALAYKNQNANENIVVMEICDY